MPGLITNPAAIWLAVAPVDMRRGIDGLSMLVQQALGQAPGYGCASAGCIKAASFGLRSAMRVFW
jgi:transposase